MRSGSPSRRWQGGPPSARNSDDKPLRHINHGARLLVTVGLTTVYIDRRDAEAKRHTAFSLAFGVQHCGEAVGRGVTEQRSATQRSAANDNQKLLV